MSAESGRRRAAEEQATLTPARALQPAALDEGGGGGGGIGRAAPRTPAQLAELKAAFVQVSDDAAAVKGIQ